MDCSSSELGDTELAEAAKRIQAEADTYVQGVVVDEASILLLNSRPAWEALTSYHRLVRGVMAPEVPSEVKGCFAPLSLLSLQATWHRAPVLALLDAVGCREVPR